MTKPTLETLLDDPLDYCSYTIDECKALKEAVIALKQELEAAKKAEVERLLRIEVKVDALIAERDELQAKLVGVERDAERYRWLHNKTGSYQGPEVWINGDYHLGTCLDAAIDADMKESK